MILKHVEAFEKATDDAAALRAARALVNELKRSPLAVHFSTVHPDDRMRPHLSRAVVHVMCLGQQVQPVRRLRLSLWENNEYDVTMLIPDVGDPGDTDEERLVKEIMEADSSLAQRTARTAELLEGVGVKVDRERIALTLPKDG